MTNVISSAFDTVTTVEQGVELLDIFMHLSTREVSVYPLSGNSDRITVGYEIMHVSVGYGIMHVSVGCGGKHVCVHTGHPENHDLQRMWKFI